MTFYIIYIYIYIRYIFIEIHGMLFLESWNAIRIIESRGGGTPPPPILCCDVFEAAVGAPQHSKSTWPHRGRVMMAKFRAVSCYFFFVLSDLGSSFVSATSRTLPYSSSGFESKSQEA